MLFTSIDFLIFLPIVFLLYWFASKRLKWQNLLIVVASYVFYGWWDWRFLLLIAFTSATSYVSGILMEKRLNDNTSQGWECKALLISNIAINILILCIFKYYNFFIDNLVLLFASFGIQLDFPTLRIILPVGISFYTFQAISYSIDVYRRKLPATHDIISFFAFISFFPQLVAGPIERATHLLPQFQRPRQFNYALAVEGTRQMLWGFFKKMIADRCALEVNDIFANYTSLRSSALLIGALLFAFQIYGDFSGYSDIAIGTAKLFGIRLMRNFHVPYFSKNMAEFWKRWHISLNTWFVDYVYIPLGGSREGKAKTVRNIFIIFLLSGLWHGANWTFLIWGLYHALLFLPLLLLGRSKTKVETDKEGKVVVGEKAINVLRMLFTFILVTMGWVIFRAESLGQFFGYMTNMVSGVTGETRGFPFRISSLIMIMLIIEWLGRYLEHPIELFNRGFLGKWRVVRWGMYIALSLLIIFCTKSQETFIYFQF